MLKNAVKEKPSFRRISNFGKLAASLIVGAAMLPQLAHSADYATTALSYSPVAFWQLAETGDASLGGLSAVDSSGHGKNGTYGTTSQNAFNNIQSPQPPLYVGFTNGQGALAPTVTDANSPVSVPFLNLNTNAVTITMWIKPAGNQAVSTGLLMNRNTSGGAAGLEFGPQATVSPGGMPALGYVWNNNAQATWSWNSGLYPQQLDWNFVALVVRSNNATLYLCYIDQVSGKTNLFSAVNTLAHNAEAWSAGVTILGGDANPGGTAADATRVFAGSVAGATVYNQALSNDQVLSLFASGFGATGFAPSITTQPQQQYLLTGGKGQMSAGGITGSSTITYQWKLNGTNVQSLSDAANFTGATSNVLTILSGTAADAGTYNLYLSNSIGYYISSNAAVVIQATNLVGQWLDGSVNGNNFLNVASYAPATNHGAYLTGGASYVFTNDVPIGKTGQSLLLYNGDTGLVVSNTSTLDPAYDDVYDNRINSAITVTCWAKGWPGNWNPFVCKYGETTPSPSGGWQLRADAGNHPCWTLRGSGGTTNGVALGQAAGGNPDDLSGTGLSLFPGDGIWHFYAGTYDASTGVRMLYVDGAYVAIETNATPYTLAQIEHLCIGCRDANGTSIANFFTGQLYDARIYNFPLTQAALDNLYGQLPGSVATQPKSTYAITNTLVQFNVTGAGTPPLSYQWRLNGTNIGLLSDAGNFTGQNSNVLTILNATLIDAGAYSVTVSNAYGGTVSSNAALNLMNKALIGSWLAGGTTFQDVSGFQASGTHDGFDLGNGGGSWFTNDLPPYHSTGSALHLQNDAIEIMNTTTNEGGYTNTFDEIIGNAMTVAFWARGYPGQWNPWVSKFGDAATGVVTSGWQLRDGGNNNNPAWTIRGAGGTVTQGTAVFGNAEDMRGTIAANNGQWHHYVGTFNASTGERRLYIDGVVSGIETGNHAYVLTKDSHVLIGARDNHGTIGAYFTGNIFDVRIYNYSVTSNEVKAIMGLPDPAFSVQPPATVNAFVGLNASIAATVAGASTGPVTNQWTLNGTNINDGPLGSGTVTGTHTSTLNIKAANTDMQGTYNLVISNPLGFATSSNSVLTVTVATPPNATNVVGAWITGATNLVDVSGYSPAGSHDGYGVTGTGTASSAYSFTNDAPPGYFGSSLLLNGTTGISISNSSTLDAAYTNTFDDTITNSMTVSFWAKGFPGQWNPWVSKYGENGAGWQLRRNNNANAGWTLRGTGGTEDMTTSINSNDGKWHFYAGTYDATTGVRSLYIDGVLAATQSGQALYTMSPASHLAFGARDNGGNSFGNYFAGQLYGIRLYNTALTPSQINSFVVLPVFGGIIRNGNQLVINWANGSLQSSTNISGPWTSVSGATSPYTNDVSTNAQMYFRVSTP